MCTFKLYFASNKPFNPILQSQVLDTMNLKTENGVIRSEDLHRDLKVHSDASEEYIRKAHRRRAKRYPILSLTIVSLVIALLLFKTVGMIAQTFQGDPHDASPNTLNHYDVLDVVPIATAVDIKRAHRRAARLNHPDKESPDKMEEAIHRMVQINAAYEVLSTRKRCDYDRYEMGGTVQAYLDCHERFWVLDIQRMNDRLREPLMERLRERKREGTRPDREERLREVEILQEERETVQSFKVPSWNAHALVVTPREPLKIVMRVIEVFYAVCYHIIVIRFGIALLGLYLGFDPCP
jgi:hypothetical protein